MRQKNSVFTLIYLAITAVFALFVLSPVYVGYGLRELLAISLAIYFFPLFFALQSAVSCVQLRGFVQNKGKFLRVCEKIRFFSSVAIAAIYTANGMGYVLARTVFGLAENEIHPDFPRFAIGTLWVMLILPFALAISEAVTYGIMNVCKKTFIMQS